MSKKTKVIEVYDPIEAIKELIDMFEEVKRAGSYGSQIVVTMETQE